jgi:creatinine amidohydrolase
VFWSELYPDEFEARRRARPVVYFPMGLCEPHGRAAALGLDLLKAEQYCARAAARYGGIVAPSQGYHVHECGYHARWLEDVVGDIDAQLSCVAPAPLLYMFLYQLRAFNNAGFKLALVLTGHAGGNEHDLRLAAECFMRRSALRVIVSTDAELVAGRFDGDHAGKFELSQLMALRPELVDLTRLERDPYGLRRFALGDDHAQASLELGQQINEAIVEQLGRAVERAQAALQAATPLPRIDYALVEAAWTELQSLRAAWRSARPNAGQAPVSDGSRWKATEHVP